MAAKKKGTGGLFEYGQSQMKQNGTQKLFPAIGDINPRLKEKSGGRRRG